MMRVKSKNIHVLPTEKPSRFHKIENEWGLTHNANSNPFAKQQNIYITSDEEIKKRDYVICDNKLYKIIVTGVLYNDDFTLQTDIEGVFLNPKYCSKIILTTDQDLIKDGVWGIEDGFLEWFVKNPACEYVELKGYAIILPEESCDCDKICNECEPKQETLEEAAELYLENVNTKVHKDLERDGWMKIGFIGGAKWQQEQVGKSEFLQRLRATISDAEARRLIFEQFKNK
jgi:hypothetical protein